MKRLFRKTQNKLTVLTFWVYICDTINRLADKVQTGTVRNCYGSVTTEYSYIRNEKGDVTRVYNGNGELAGEYFYDAYGNCGTDGHC